MPPVTAFFIAYVGATGVTAAVAAAAFPVATSIGAFLGTTVLGSILVNVAVNIGLSYFMRDDGTSVQDSEAALVNSKALIAARMHLGGNVAAAGTGAIFGEFDEDGNFWYIVAHGDGELTNTPTYFMDGIEVTLSDGTDGFTAGDVLTDDFCLDDSLNPYESGTKVPYYRIYTVTPDVSNVYGTKPSAFTTAFSNLPSDFYLTGVVYSIVRVAAVPVAENERIQHRHKIFRWGGPLGLGEPKLKIYGNFARVPDPREVTFDEDDPDTWLAGDGNPAILWAWWRTHPFGLNRPASEINWTKVEEAADICDEQVLNRSAEYVDRYRCGVAGSEETKPYIVEGKILATCDGFVAQDDTGKAYPVVGDYVTPTYTFTKERSIMSFASEEVDDGESAVDGVIVEYTSPDHNYTLQRSAPWQNPLYYSASSTPNYKIIKIHECYDHNQAFRLAGAIGARVGATHRAALGTNIHGILVKNERGITLEYDDVYDGVYEIVSPVQENETGQAVRFAVVPLASNRWDGAGQSEGVPAALTPALNIDDSLAVASNVVITVRRIDTDTGKALRIEATFDTPSRVDRAYQFRYEVDTNVYEYFTVDMVEERAWSAIVSDGTDYDVQWQTVTAGGRASGWAADVGGGESVYTVTATANDTAPDDLVAASAAAGGAGEIDLTWTTANDVNQASVVPYIGSTFGTAVAQTPILSGANVSGSATLAGISAGSTNVWLVPANGSGVEGNEDGPHAVTVT